MRYSLISRDSIADCIEIMHEGYFADAIITLGGCDKTVPGALMPIARLNLVGITLFGGPALPGSCDDITLTDRGLDPGQVHHFHKWQQFLSPAQLRSLFHQVMEAIGAYPAGVIDIEELYRESRRYQFGITITIETRVSIPSSQDRVQRPSGERHLQRHVHRLHDGLRRGGPGHGRARNGLAPRRHRRKFTDRSEETGLRRLGI